MCNTQVRINSLRISRSELLFLIRYAPEAKLCENLCCKGPKMTILLLYVGSVKGRISQKIEA